MRNLVISRWALAFLSALMLAFVFGSTVSAGEKKILIKINAHKNPKTPGTADMPLMYLTQAIKDRLEERFPGRVQVRIYWDNQLAKTYENAMNALQNNVIQLSYFPLNSIAEFTHAAIPLSNLFLFPYPHTQLVYDAYDGEIGRMLSERILKDAKVRPVCYWEVGYRHLLNNKKQIETLEDLKGMKIRVQPNPVHIESFKALGANPTPVTWSEVFTALQQGVVDGTENPYDNIYTARLYEVQKYLTLTGHAFEMGAYCISEEFYQKLPEDIRVGFDELMAELTQEFRVGMAKKDEWFKDYFEKELAANELSAAELEKFAALVEPMKEMSRKQAGEEYSDTIYEIIKNNQKAYFEKITK